MKSNNSSKRFIFGIQFKAMALVITILSLSALVTVNFFSHRTQELIQRHASERIGAIADSVSFNAEYGLLVQDIKALDKLVYNIKSQKDIVYALIYNQDGKLISTRPEKLDDAQVNKIFEAFKKAREKKTSNRQIFYQFDLTGAGAMNAVGELIYSIKTETAPELGLFEAQGNMEMIGSSILVYSGESIRLEVGESQKQILFIHLALAGAISLFMFIFVIFFLKGLTRLKTAAQKIGEGAFETRVVIKTHDELEDLGDNINQMAENLQKITVSRDSLIKEIDERKRLENIVLQTEKMAAVGQLAGGVAHEINNPLGVILGFAQGVVKRIQPGDPLEMPLKSIEREAIRCKNLVQDLLTFSRIGKSEKESVDLNDVIESSLSLVAAQVKIKGSQLITEYDRTIPRGFANANQIQQIIVNLCTNALDAMPGGGTITLKTKKAVLNRQEMIEIQIQDTGQGIQPDVQKRIFEPFFTTKEVGKGTGLGLSLVYEIVQKHAGQVRVESKVGIGTSFFICIPAVSHKKN